MYWEDCLSSLFFSLYLYFLQFVLNVTVDFHCCFLSRKFVFLSLDGTQTRWLLILFSVCSVALYLYILRKQKRPKILSQGTDWQALLLLSAIFKQHGRTALLNSGRLKWLCLTISHFSTSPFFLVSAFIKDLWMIAALRSSLTMFLQNSLTCVHSSVTSFSLCYVVCRFLSCLFSFSCFLGSNLM